MAAARQGAAAAAGEEREGGRHVQHRRPDLRERLRGLNHTVSGGTPQELVYTITTKGSKPGVLGRSAATGRYVLAPAATKKATVSDQRIAAAVKSVLAKKK